MNSTLQHVIEVGSQPSRKIIGLMSGTSLDGLDIALCEVGASGSETTVELLEFTTVGYPEDVAEKMERIISVPELDSEQLCLAHSWLAELHADLVIQALQDWELEPHEIDAIASHGQTVYHAPRIQHKQQEMPNATLQIGDGDHIARKTGILTISDFRQKHTAAGGEGAPMVALVDRLLFSDPETDRLLLNIGGIANFTYLPAQTSGNQPLTGDTGPGNTLINAAVQKHFDRPFDDEGKIASGRTVHANLLKELLDHPYFQKKLPKTTGPEVFNLEWVEEVIRKHSFEVSPENLVATLTWFSAETIADAIKEIETENLPEIYISGGGMHNRQLIAWISKLLEGAELNSFEEIGFYPDAKEAVCFAVLANETLAGNGFLMSPKVGTERRVNFGKISLPV